MLQNTIGVYLNQEMSKDNNVSMNLLSMHMSPLNIPPIISI